MMISTGQMTTQYQSSSSCNFMGQSVGVKESFPIRLVVFVWWWMNHVPNVLYTFLGISEFCKQVSANSVPQGGGAGSTKHRTARSLLISAYPPLLCVGHQNSGGKGFHGCLQLWSLRYKGIVLMRSQMKCLSIDPNSVSCSRTPHDKLYPSKGHISNYLYWHFSRVQNFKLPNNTICINRTTQM